MRYRIDMGNLYIDDRLLGAATSLYVSSAEKQAVKDSMRQSGVKMCYLPFGDFVMANGSYVIGVESKKAQDLVTSWKTRRLAKQIRDLLDAVDVACLAIDMAVFDERNWPYYNTDLSDLDKLRVDVVKLQMLGVKILPRPKDNQLVTYLAEVRRQLTPTASLLSVISGSPHRQRAGAMKKFLMGIEGVGPKMADRILEQFGTAARALGVSEPPPWTTKRIREGRRKALYGDD